MAGYERDYARGRRMGARLPTVTKWLLVSNLAIYFADMLLFGFRITRWGAFTADSAFLQGRLWELLSFQFLHGSVGHVLFNSIGLYFFAPFVERWWGTRRFLGFYLLCGAAGAVFYTVLLALGLIPNSSFATPLVGASAGLFGILFAIYVIDPDQRVMLLLPPVEMKMRTLALVYAGLSVVTILGGLLFPRNELFWNSGGEAGHLGGALMGLLLMKMPWLLRHGRRPGRKVVRPKAFRGKPKLRPRTRVDLDSASEIDRILDKVTAEGFGSLTEEERRVLEDASREKR